MEKLKRSEKYGIGKQISNNVYVHKSYESVLPSAKLEKAKKGLPATHSYNIIKYNFIENKFSFIFSPDFDKANEPKVGPYVVVNLATNQVKVFPNKTRAIQIYHHKWLMVGDDYKGFSVAKAKQRSADTSSMSVNKYKIGFKTYWDVALRRNNLPL